MKDLITKHLDITAMTMKGMENGFDKRTDKPTGANQEGET